ncbi:hypothetical protein TNCT_206111 [Trichonephila clavata]|uniref:Uncharacterized protein n=1 Tax=Trichonephila clavata TaxID=2740835 RepID=A0A8X6LT46_TRICU|nr:hypothetical protein TNCT_206111 [Trichonephila clavata]
MDLEDYEPQSGSSTSIGDGDGHQIFERSLKNHQGIPSHFQSGNEASNPRKGSAPLFLKENSKLTAKKKLPFPELLLNSSFLTREIPQ